MVTVARKWGNSLAVRLPKAAADAANIHNGSPLDIRTEGGRVIMTPVGRKKYRIEDLVRKITPKNRHPEIDWGPPRGSEIW